MFDSGKQHSAEAGVSRRVSQADLVGTFVPIELGIRGLAQLNQSKILQALVVKKRTGILKTFQYISKNSNKDSLNLE